MHSSDKKNQESGFSLIELLIVSVILAFSIGIIATIVTNIQANYTQQRARTEAVDDATAALDMVTRLIRTAGNNPNNIAGLQAIDPETPVNGLYKTIRIRSDWRGATISSYPDGDTGDPFENVRFLVQNNKLMKQEATDGFPVPFLDNVVDMQFLYYDTNNVMILDPNSNLGSIARIDITMIMQPPQTQTTMTFASSAYVRAR